MLWLRDKNIRLLFSLVAWSESGECTFDIMNDKMLHFPNLFNQSGTFILVLLLRRLSALSQLPGHSATG